MSDLKTALQKKRKRHQRRRLRGRKRLLGSSEKPRLIVYRSNNHIYAQLRDDMNEQTITGCSTLTPELLEKIKNATGNIEKAKIIGEYIAKLANDRKIERVSFDRNGRRYHGRIKALADGARSAGLKF
ncbi:MAG: 50S ribosomal protein L18 [Calditrichaeota bacterium]|nr:50S ribosomal protein L18 [Calditrichota bacterium]